jgi:hypothetical protein
MGDSFDTGMAVNARNRADAYLKGGAAKRTGDLAKQGSGLFGYYKGKDLLADAGAYEQQQQANASMFGDIANLAGGIGANAVLGGFGGGPGKMATLDSTPMTVENAYGSSVSYYDPNIYTGVGDF